MKNLLGICQNCSSEGTWWRWTTIFLSLSLKDLFLRWSSSKNTKCGESLLFAVSSSLVPSLFRYSAQNHGCGREALERFFFGIHSSKHYLLNNCVILRKPLRGVAWCYPGDLSILSKCQKFKISGAAHFQIEWNLELWNRESAPRTSRSWKRMK